MTLTCVDCNVTVGTIYDKTVPSRCDPCRTKLVKRDQGPTVGESLSDAQRFREEIELDAVTQN